MSEDSGFFDQLISIKRNREQRLRSQLMEGEEHLKENQKKLEIMIAQREQLQQEWRQLGNDCPGKVSTNTLTKLKEELDLFYARDKELKACLHELESRINAWSVQKESLIVSIRQACIEQEKLKYIVEN